jgi:mannitol/fructose-specific phosphotransferase system IIA component (Ntr-type)
LHDFADAGRGTGPAPDGKVVNLSAFPGASMILSRLLRPDSVITDLRSRDRDGVLRELAANLAHQSELDQESLFPLFTSRESEGSTGVWGGLALPHCFTPLVRQPVACVARSRMGVDFGSIDGRPSRFFVGLVSPLQQAYLHPQFAAHIKALFHTPYFKHTLLQATSGIQILNEIYDAEAEAHHPPSRAA